MKISNFLKTTSLLLFIAFTIPSSSIASNKFSPINDSTENVRVIGEIIRRVSEIQNMDKNNLSVSEKKQLKNELKELKHRAEGHTRGVYLSVGAIIIIILLLILIL